MGFVLCKRPLVEGEKFREVYAWSRGAGYGYLTSCSVFSPNHSDTVLTDSLTGPALTAAVLTGHAFVIPSTVHIPTSWVYSPALNILLSDTLWRSALKLMQQEFS